MHQAKKPNRLIQEKSPYLLQHSYNPVDWFAWGEEAFAKANSEDKPILLSIGYATCHWCHVMERESFEDEKTAEILNRDFVCIKVDREERPDVDKIYMDALHAMDQQGGWPLNMFLTPDKKPIAGGTYFPPVPKYGRRSFIEVLGIIKEAWDTRREELKQSVDNLVTHLKEKSNPVGGKLLPDLNSFENATRQFESFFDPTFYGFKTNMVNKFPPSMGISFLLFNYRITKNALSLEMAEKTLTAMKKGGIYDQVGGGISRYSTDQKWIVPHFEKMLYDNSLFLFALVECYQATKKEFYKESAYDIISYIQRDMRLPGGGIASAEDADSEGEEGKFYVWSLSEFREICKEDSFLLEKFWNLTEEGNFEGQNILNESFDIDFALQNNLDPQTWKSRVKSAREKLLSARSKRIRPLRDDKILTSWNALYIRALAFASFVFDDKNLLAQAEETYNFIYKNLFDKSGRLQRRFRDAEARFNAYLSDYAELANASIYLYQASLKEQYVANSAHLTDEAIRLFSSPAGVFYETGIDSEELITRSIEGYDGVEPSGNSTMAFVLLKLSSFGIKSDEYENRAEEVFAYFSEELEKRAISHPFMLSAYYFFATQPYEIVLSGKIENVQQAIEDLRNEYLPDVVLASGGGLTSSLLPLVQGREKGNDFTAYVCRNRTCEMPLTNLNDFLTKLKKEIFSRI